MMVPTVLPMKPNIRLILGTAKAIATDIMADMPVMMINRIWVLSVFLFSKSR
jgi:hypothetical protein